MNIGKIVCSAAGHDKGRYMIVVKENGNNVLVCDGKTHRLETPKTKNIKHLKITEHSVREEQIKSNKALRKAIFSVMNGYKEETKCQKKI